MKRLLNSSRGWLLVPGLAAIWLLAWTGPITAQVMTSIGGGSGGSTFGGTFGGSSFSGSSGGSSFGGGFSGGTIGGGSSGGGSFGGGGSFSGTSGGSFSGNSGGFGTTSGSNFRTTAGNAASATGVTTYSVAPSNPFATYYINPLGMGLPSSTGTATQTTFGRPLYTYSSTGTTTGTSGTFGNSLGGLQGGTGAGGISTTVFSGTGLRSSVNYGVGVNLPGPSAVAGSPKVLNDVRAIVARSSSLPSKDRIRVGLDNNIVVLQGTVADDHERRLAAALISLTPGVHEIRNELQLPGPGPVLSFP